MLKKLKMAPTALPPIARNASTAFPAGLFSASASLFNHLFKTLLSFDGGPPTPPPSPKTPVIASTMVQIVIERAVSTEKMVMPCSRHKVRIFSAKDYFYQKPFQGSV